MCTPKWRTGSNKPFNYKRLLQKVFLSQLPLGLGVDFMAAKKPKTAEEEKKKQAYYSKGEKKASAVKKK